MVALITDEKLEQRLIAIRRDCGTDKYDEVWEGIYVMAPMADNEHQHLVTELATILRVTVTWNQLGEVYAGVNISDRDEAWTENYRCPDVAVFLKQTQAENRGTHWYGGSEFVIEVVSKNDRTLEKLAFYASVGTREVLVIDRDPWSISLHCLENGKMVCEATSAGSDAATVASHIVPLSWRLSNGAHPRIEVVHLESQQTWTIQSAKD